MRLRESWFTRQLDLAAKEVRTWPEWARKEAAIDTALLNKEMTLMTAPVSGFELGEKAANIAMAWAKAGMRETHGANRSPQIDKIESVFGLQGEPWCAMFALYCYLKPLAAALGYADSPEGWRKALPVFRSHYVAPSPSCTVIMNDAKRRGLWREWNDGEGARKGDLVLYNFDDDSDAEHIGILHHVDERAGKKLAVVIEGNTSPGNAGSQADGQGVYVRSRPANKIFGTVAIHTIRGL